MKVYKIIISTLSFLYVVVNLYVYLHLKSKHDQVMLAWVKINNSYANRVNALEVLCKQNNQNSALNGLLNKYNININNLKQINNPDKNGVIETYKANESNIYKFVLEIEKAEFNLIGKQEFIQEYDSTALKGGNNWGEYNGNALVYHETLMSYRQKSSYKIIITQYLFKDSTYL